MTSSAPPATALEATGHAPRRPWAGVVLPLTGRLSYPGSDLVLRYLREGWFEHSELVLMARLLRPGDVFLDVGAHCGLYSALASKRFNGNGTIVIVEPNPDLHPFIRANVQVSAETVAGPVNAGATTLVNAAIFTDASEKPFHVSSDTYSAYSSITAQDDSILHDQITVKTRTLSSLLPASRGQGLTFIKLDTEGAELAILRQALPQMAGMTGIHLLIEFDENNLVRSGTASGELARCISEAGLKLAFFDDEHNRLAAYDGAFPVWGRNFIATRDLVGLNERLSTLTDPWLTLTEDYLAQGHAAQRLYEKSEQLNRLLADTAILKSRIAGEVAATERRALPAAEQPVHGGMDGEQRPRERVEAAIRELNEEFGRLQGAMEWLRSTTARQDNALIQVEYSRNALLETITSAVRTLKRLHEKMHGPTPEPPGSPAAAQDAPALRDRLYDMLGRVEGDVDWFQQEHRDISTAIEKLKSEQQELQQALTAADARTNEAFSALEAAKAGFAEEQQRARALAAREMAKAVADAESSTWNEVEGAIAARADIIAAESTKRIQEEWVSFVPSLRYILDNAARDLRSARTDIARLIAFIRQWRNQAAKSGRLTPSLVDALQSVEASIQGTKTALASSAQQLRNANALVPETVSSKLQGEDHVRSQAADVQQKLRALKDLHGDLIRLNKLADELRQSQWLRLGGKAGTRVTQLATRLFAMSEVVCQDAQFLVSTTPPAQGREEQAAREPAT